MVLFPASSGWGGRGEAGARPRLNAGVKSPFAAVAREVGDSVVYISGVHETERSGSLYHIREKRKFPGAGSGFIFRTTGKRAYILTNHHVIGSAKTLEATLADRTRWTAEVVGTDPKTDLAVLSIEADRPVKAVRFGDSEAVAVGDWAVAIGNPLPIMKNGDLLNVHEQTVTAGIISAKHRSRLEFGANEDTPLYQDYLQIDAPINGGSSGGPLFDIHGEVIGVNSAIFSPVRLNIGIGFAIPSNLARRIADDLIRHGRVVRAYLGLYPQAVTDDIRRAMRLKDLGGVLVARVSDNGPAGKAGVRKGDVIVSYAGERVKSMSAFKMAVADSTPGVPVRISAIRAGEPLVLDVVPEEYPRRELISSISVPRSSHWLGIQVRGDGKRALEIIAIEPYTPADRSDLRKGDVILEINGEPVADWNDYKEAAKRLRDARHILFYVQRGSLNLFAGVNSP